MPQNNTTAQAGVSDVPYVLDRGGLPRNFPEVYIGTIAPV